MVDITQIVLAILSLIGVLITSLLVPWLKNKLNAQQQDKLNKFIDILVYAAEQIFPPEMGEQKKAWVKERLNAQGYDANMDMIDAQIEAVVKELRIKMKIQDQ